MFYAPKLDSKKIAENSENEELGAEEERRVGSNCVQMNRKKSEISHLGDHSRKFLQT